ncbi:hypothetical protein [Streptomyces sp. NPDC002122]|uniref:hypothetical protein n=1 Tax=Streptomyces sp. NPDC002122 TaxID=3154407 RepID=UPI00332E33C3
MDFLLLTPDRSRIVIEVDGVQHYADATGKASPRLYSEMVAEDRRLRLMGYDIYRFGGHELARDEQDRRLPVVLVSSGVLSRPRLTPRPVSLTKPPLVDALHLSQRECHRLHARHRGEDRPHTPALCARRRRPGFPGHRG